MKQVYMNAGDAMNMRITLLIELKLDGAKKSVT